MRVVCVYRDNQDYTRTVDEWLENFHHQTGREIEIMDPDKNPGFCEAYDIVEYPTVIAMGHYASARAVWRGKDSLPLINDVLFYMI